MVNLRDFETSTTDYTSAFQAAFDAMPDGETLYIPRGTYPVSGSTALTSSKSLTIVCEPGAVIDATAMTVPQGFPLFEFLGSMESWTALAADAATGAQQLSVDASLAVSLDKGDLLRLTTDRAMGGSGATWRGLGSSYWKGEIVEVVSVSGTSVTLKSALYDGYLAAETRV